MPDSIERRAIHFTGMVQGVGFRYTARRLAEDFALTGFVQNLRDGRVLLELQGPREEIERFLAAIMAELGHYITDNEQKPLEPIADSLSFEIRF